MVRITYNPNTNTFNDGSFIDWYTWMSVNETHFIHEHDGIVSPEKYMDSLFFGNGGKTYKMQCPIRRYDDVKGKYITVRGDMTVREVLQEIYNFYQEYVTPKEFKKYYDDNYVEDARDGFKQGKKFKRFELVGFEGFMFGDDNYGNLFLCSGLVGYKSVRKISGNKYKLFLGS